MTTKEVLQVTHARQAQMKEFSQTLAWVIYNGAALTGLAVNDPSKFPSLENAFPTLFEEDGQQDWRITKARMEGFAQANNEKLAQQNAQKGQ